MKNYDNIKTLRCDVCEGTGYLTLKTLKEIYKKQYLIPHREAVTKHKESITIAKKLIEKLTPEEVDVIHAYLYTGSTK